MVLFLIIVGFFFFLCTKVLNFVPGGILKEPEIPVPNPEPSEKPEVTSETINLEESEDVEDDVVADLERRIDELLNDNGFNSWIEKFQQNTFKIEGDKLTKDLYEPGFSLPNAMLCPDMGNTLRALIFITSAPDHFAERKSIRDTWGSIGREPGVVMSFLIGATHNDTMEQSLKTESDTYQDLIRGNFIDSYRNLTLKTLSMMEWTINYCPMTPFVLKTDDDMFVNMDRVLDFMDEHNEATKSIFGNIARNWQPMRNPSAKWYLPEEVFRSYVYPNFATGPIYLLTGDIVMDLYKEATETPFLWLEDVFFTGFLAEALKIPRIDIGKVVKRMDAKNLPCEIPDLIALHQVNVTEQYEFWTSIHNMEIMGNCLEEIEEKEVKNNPPPSAGIAFENINEVLQTLMEQIKDSLEQI
ncbi:hypothetical protein DMENIID0001_108860 [Sergentomyia squamirostris]